MSVGRRIARLAIVNRGEAAVRCIRAVKALAAESGRDIQAIALYTETERDAPFVRYADFAVELPVPDDSPRGAVAAYLDHDAILRALREARADAVWPGWGFVAEDPVFVDRLRDRRAAGRCRWCPWWGSATAGRWPGSRVSPE